MTLELAVRYKNERPVLNTGVYLMRPFLIVLTAIGLFLCFGWAVAAKESTGLSVQTLKGKSGANYQFFQKNNLSIAFAIRRPSSSDTEIKLSIPAAFTTREGSIGGLYAHEGKFYNSNRVDTSLGGAIEIVDGDFKIFATSQGACFTKEYRRRLEQLKGSMFQQFQIVEKGVAAKFKDKTHFQRRAIVEFTNGRKGIIESDRAITFEIFNTDLAALGVEDALYTDMGAWDEGWYRDAKTGTVKPLGLDRSLTHKQTNWVVLKEK